MEPGFDNINIHDSNTYRDWLGERRDQRENKGGHERVIGGWHEQCRVMYVSEDVIVKPVTLYTEIIKSIFMYNHINKIEKN